MFGRLMEFLGHLSVAAKPILRLDPDGFSVVQKGHSMFRVRWSDVGEVFAFKQDLGTFDRICLGFRMSESGECHLVDEEIEGYSALVERLPRVFSGADREWWLKVAFPAFATNYTIIWGQPP